MERYIQAIDERHLIPALDLVEDVFTQWDSPEEGKMVRHLVEEIRAKKYYLPELELIMSMTGMKFWAIPCFPGFISRGNMKMNCFCFPRWP